MHAGIDLPIGAWGLCDSNAFLKTPSEFIARVRFFTIQATSPQPERYVSWVKEKEGDCYYMEVFSEKEILQLGYDSGLVFICHPTQTLSAIYLMPPQLSICTIAGVHPHVIASPSQNKNVRSPRMKTLFAEPQTQSPRTRLCHPPERRSLRLPVHINFSASGRCPAKTASYLQCPLSSRLTYN